MEKSPKKKIDWDDDDPYAIPDDKLPKIKPGGDVEIEEPGHHNRKKSGEHKERKNSHGKHEERKKSPERDSDKEHKRHHKDKKLENGGGKKETDEYDPLQNPPKAQSETKTEALYPSLVEISKHVDDETQKASDAKEEPKTQSKKKTREGTESCKQCVVQ